MPHSNQTARRPLRFAEKATGATAFVLVAALSAGCGSEPPRGLLDGSWPTGNCGTTPPPPGMQYTCTPDPGSKPVKCADEEAGLELVTLGDFSQPLAGTWYIYIDNSGTGRITSLSTGWQSPTVPDPFPRCDNGSASQALHIQGGPFLGWGGGFGTSIRDFLSGPLLPPDYNCSAPPRHPLCADSKNPFAWAMVDASTFEGVALWARRGPDSQGGIRVMVADQNTDDDISYLTYLTDPSLPRNCERTRECACTNHKDCTRWASSPLDTNAYPQLASWANSTTPMSSSSCAYGVLDPGYYCEDPNSGVVPGYQTTAATDTNCNTCNTTKCNQPYPAFPNGPPIATFGDASLGDLQFYNKPCTPYTTRGGTPSAYCYDPATDPPPAESDQTCGDHWTTPIYLTNQWTLYLVPFTTMQQQGYGKKFGKMDVHAVTMVRVTWDGGYIDYWIGKIAFYRHKS